MKFNLIGNTFGTDVCATHGKVSKHIEWDRSGYAMKGTFHIDHAIFNTENSFHTKECRYDWIKDKMGYIL